MLTRLRKQTWPTTSEYTACVCFVANDSEFAVPRYEGAEYSGGEDEPMDDYDEPQVCTS